MLKKNHFYLDIGDQVDWIDPDAGVCSNKHTIVDIRTETKRVEDLDTVLILENDCGGLTEALVLEVA